MVCQLAWHPPLQSSQGKMTLLDAPSCMPKSSSSIKSLQAVKMRIFGRISQARNGSSSFAVLPSTEMEMDLPGLGKQHQQLQSPCSHPWIGMRSSWQESQALALKLHLSSLLAASNEHQGSSFLTSGLDLYAQHFTLSTEETFIHVATIWNP